MPKDVDLKLVDAAAPIVDTTALAAIDVEGGWYGVVRLNIGTITDADETFNITVECSVDGGSNYFHIGEFPTIVAADDNIEIARPVFIPRRAAGDVKVRLKARAVAGTTPSLPCTAFLEPLLSLAAPAVDQSLISGVALLT